VVSGPALSSLDVGRVGCGLGEDSLAFCWGANADDQLGHFGGQPPPLDPCLNNNPKGCSLTPRQVSPNDTTPASYRRVTVGGHHVCGLSQAPDSLLAFCWGTGPFGALGNAAVTTSPTPVPVAGGLRFLVLVAGGDHTCGIATSGATYCWGANGNGQLGRGTIGDAGTPDAITPGAFDSLTAGGQHTCALTSLGEASCWGLGSSGRLGNGSTGVQRTPVAVSGGLRFTALSAGESHTCGVASDGSLYCWGRGAEGQLGTGDLANHTTPTRVAEP
jgi:alpha-tubulin suppressor-like RCC1 family protein